MERYSFSGEDLINLDISVWRKKLDKAENRRKKKIKEQWLSRTKARLPRVFSMMNRRVKFTILDKSILGMMSFLTES